MTRGHLHAIADRSELYVGSSGRGVMISDTLDGCSEVVEVTPGKVAVADDDGYAVKENPEHRGYELAPRP